MTRLRRPLVLVFAGALAALAAVVLVACGSSDSGSQSPTQVLAETFGPGKSLKSGKLELSLAIKPKVGQPTSFSVAGPFQSEGANKLPAFDLAINASVSGQSLAAGLTSTGTKGYVTLDNTAYVLSDDAYAQFRTGYESAKSKATTKQSNAPTLQKLGIDPRRWLTGAKIVGNEDVGGAATIHITAGVSVPKLLADISTLLGKAGSLGLDSGATGTTPSVPKSLTPAQIASVTKAVKGVRVDVFTGKDDKTLRRAVIVLNLKTASGQSVGGFIQGTITINLTISDLNQTQTITPPANPKPFSELQSQLQGLLGSALGDSSGSSGGSADSGSAAGASKYLECVQKAGNDLAEVQACATLVGQ